MLPTRNHSSCAKLKLRRRSSLEKALWMTTSGKNQTDQSNKSKN
ncbi:unnamed protein product [Strongylus vulgaris]|uniref:Uncharacterized protein n=1 Tax=Strongylus vulgaris TaxID=40348 RepID=A0A3P7K094_STRVU|nr:unnamed protein product [Strongylus vulgaris]